MPKDRLRHRRIDLPSYQFIVYERPSSLQRRGNSTAFKRAVQFVAKAHIATPITSDDIEVEICWATTAREGVRADIDNIIKPTMDALIGIAYRDDKQVRSVTSMLIDRRRDNTLSGYVEDMGPLLYSNREHAVQIAIYSDIRMTELGGEDSIRKRRNEEFERRFNLEMQRQIRNVIRNKRI